MVIGQFVDTYPPSLDGVGRVALSYCETLSRMGHEVYYIAPEAPGSEDVYAFPLLLSHSLPIPGEPFRFGMPALDVRYRIKVDRIPFDIVHAHSPFSAGLEALRIARKLNVPLVTTFHSKYYQDFYDRTHSRVLAKTAVELVVHFYDHCDAVWSVNSATADVLHEYGYRKPVTVMENGTNREPLTAEGEAALNERVSLPDDEPVLLFVGQHHYKKNLHGILEACALLKQQGQPFHLVTAGQGPDFDAIVNEATDRGIGEQCSFLGFMDKREELMALYHRADLLVFPSVYDNAPMVMREAAVMGTPAVVVAGSCSAEGIVDGVNGFLCRDESAEAIAETILRALPLADTVGKKAEETIPVQWDDIMVKVVEAYQKLIAEKKTKHE